MAVLVSLEPEATRDLGRHVVEAWTDDVADRSEWIAKLPEWLRMYLNEPETKTLPWTGASNLHVPVTATVVNAYHAWVMGALFNPQPLAGLRAVERSDETTVQQQERFLDWALRQEIRLFPILDRAMLALLLNGVQVVKTTWDFRVRHVRDPHDFPASAPLPEVIADLSRSEVGLIEGVVRTGGTVEASIKGRGPVSLEIEERPLGGYRIFTEREEIVRDAPTVTMLDPEDLVWPSDAGMDLVAADHLVHRYWMPRDEILRLAQRGVFRSLTSDERDTLERLENNEPEPDDETGAIKEARGHVVGAAVTGRSGGPSTIELLDGYLRWDINDDGYDEEIVVTVIKAKPDLVLRIARLESLYRHGRRPFTAFSLFPLPSGQWGAVGLPYLLAGLQDEINTIHNQRVDAGTISNTPWFFYVPAAGLPVDRMPLEPGVGLPVDDVNAVKEHQPQNYTAWGFQEEALLWELVERLTRVSDLTLGRIGNNQGAARTATGVQQLTAQQATGRDIIIRRVQEGFADLVQQILALYRQYMPPGKVVRITGELGEPEALVTREDLLAPMDVVLSGNSLSTDREIERNTMTFLAQSALNPQVLGFLMQLQITTPSGVAEWYRQLLRVFDVPRVDRIIQTPPAPPVRDMETIVNEVLAGRMVAPIPGEPHGQVIQALSARSSTPDAALWPAEIAFAVRQQIQARQQAAQQELIQQQMAMLRQQAQAGAPGAGPGGQPVMPPYGQGGAPIPLIQGQQGVTLG